jgi:NADPH2:quinone reductase
MSRAIVVRKTGAAGNMKWEEVKVPKPKANEVKLRHTAIGLNFIDVYFRTGLYPAPAPFTPGMEGCGVITELGRNVKGFKVGDRVAYGRSQLGGYAEERIIPADMLVKVPKEIDDVTAAAMMLQGMTVEYLLERTYKVRKGDTILFHAAAGGVGQIAIQWAKALGATVIGTVGSPAKAKLAKSLGCDHVIDYRKQDFVKRVKTITKGQGVPVVYDSVGKATIDGSLQCLAPRGLLALFGQSSGPVPPFDLARLAGGGSLYITRPTLFTYTAERKDLERSARRLFSMVSSGKVKIDIGQTYPLKDAAKAHRDLEGRKTTGSTVLIP